MGGLQGRSAQGRRIRTRTVGSIDRGVALNRVLWVLAEEIRSSRPETKSPLHGGLLYPEIGPGIRAVLTTRPGTLARQSLCPEDPST